jgi:hypothetical protein
MHFRLIARTQRTKRIFVSTHDRKSSPRKKMHFFLENKVVLTDTGIFANEKVPLLSKSRQATAAGSPFSA